MGGSGLARRRDGGVGEKVVSELEVILIDTSKKCPYRGIEDICMSDSAILRLPSAQKNRRAARLPYTSLVGCPLG